MSGTSTVWSKQAVPATLSSKQLPAVVLPPPVHESQQVQLQAVRVHDELQQDQLQDGLFPVHELQQVVQSESV
jgi:hypothetical protein